MSKPIVNQFFSKWRPNDFLDSNIKYKKWKIKQNEQQLASPTGKISHYQQFLQMQYSKTFHNLNPSKFLTNCKLKQSKPSRSSQKINSLQYQYLQLTKKVSDTTPLNKTIKKQPLIQNKGLSETASTNSNDQSKKILTSRKRISENNKKASHIIAINSKKFTILSQLGSGKSGRVLLVVQNSTGMVMAIKVIPKTKIIQEKLLQQLIRELKIQAFLNHPNIIQLYGFFADQDNFYILMELGSDGQLYSHIQNGRKMSQQSTSYIIRSLLNAVECLHRYNIIHRDIKPQNIVVVHGNIKLCDFGWCVQIKEQLRTTYCGTPLYFSPEIIKGMQYDEKVDIWAIGILTYELMVGTTPFGIKQKDQLFKIVTQNLEFSQSRINKYSIYFKQFVKAILKKDPRQRLNCKKLLQMPFINRYKDLQTCEELCKLSH